MYVHPEEDNASYHIIKPQVRHFTLHIFKMPVVIHLLEQFRS